jgi:hypothetical protein
MEAVRFLVVELQANRRAEGFVAEATLVWLDRSNRNQTVVAVPLVVDFTHSPNETSGVFLFEPHSSLEGGVCFFAPSAAIGTTDTRPATSRLPMAQVE